MTKTDPKRKPGRRRKYTGDAMIEIARRRRYWGDTLAELQDKYNISAPQVIQTVSRVLREHQGAVRHQFLSYTRDGHQQKLEELVCRTLMAIDPEFEPKSAFQLSYAHKNLFSDLQLLQGLPTEIHEHLIDHRDNLREARRRIIASLPEATQKALSEGKGLPEGEKKAAGGAFDSHSEERKRLT